MTNAKLTPAELRLLNIQKARGIPYPDDIFAWRKANAAAIAALEPQIQAGTRIETTRNKSRRSAREHARRLRRPAGSTA